MGFPDELIQAAVRHASSGVCQSHEADVVLFTSREIAGSKQEKNQEQGLNELFEDRFHIAFI